MYVGRRCVGALTGGMLAMSLGGCLSSDGSADGDAGAGETGGTFGGGTFGGGTFGGADTPAGGGSPGAGGGAAPVDPNPLPAAEGPVELAVSSDFVCMRTNRGRVFCWDAAEPPLDAFGPPREVPGLDSVVDLDVNGGTACAVEDDGDVLCWGENRWDYFRDGVPRDSATPVEVQGLPPMRSVAVSLNVVCAQPVVPTLEKPIHCWGNDVASLLGPFGPDDAFPAFFAERYRVDRAESIQGLVSGANSFCALFQDEGTRAAFCWGDPGFGQLGESDAEDVAFDSFDAEDLGADGTLLDVAVGSDHTCAVARAGSAGVRCFGYNQWGESAPRPPSRGSVRSPLIDTLDLAVDVAVGQRHTCALLADGLVRCIGDNQQGQRGDASVSPGHDANEVPGVTGAVGLWARNSFTCALEADGRVLCWGSRGRVVGAGLPYELTRPEGVPGPADLDFGGVVRPDPGPDPDPGPGPDAGPPEPPTTAPTAPPTMADPDEPPCRRACARVYQTCGTTFTDGAAEVDEAACLALCLGDAFGVETRDCLTISACDLLAECFELGGAP